MNSMLMRHLHMLSMIPRHPCKISISDLEQKLRDKGFEVGKRTLQRNLRDLAQKFPLQSDERSKPFGWSWHADARVFNLPHMDIDTALAFHLAKQHLSPLLPPSTIKKIEPHFVAADKVLDHIRTQHGAPAWRHKVRVLQRGPDQQPPTVSADIQTAIYDGLLRNRRVDIQYLARGKRKVSHYPIQPLGLVSKNGMFYLVCTIADYSDIRQISLHRIQQAKVLDIPVVPPVDFDLDAYIASGEMKCGSRGEIQLKAVMDKDMAAHLSECPLHEDQQLTCCESGRYLLQVSVQDTDELRWWLRGYGVKVEILEPSSLRQTFKKMAEKIAQSYA